MKLIKAAITLTGLVVLAYFVFMVPLGEKTFFEHVTRISQTPEAQDLSSELQKKVETAGLSIKRKLDGALDTDTSNIDEKDDASSQPPRPQPPRLKEGDVTKADKRALKELLEELEKE